MLLSFTSKAESGFNPRVLTGGRDSRRIVRTEPQRGFNPRVLTGGRDLHLFCHGIYYQFQSTVLTGGRDSQSIVSVIAAMFQSTRPRGRTRRESYEKFQPAKLFQSTRPRGRTRLPAIRQAPERNVCFNPRVLAGGRDLRRRHTRHTYRFQSTRPRGRTRLVRC